jgi:flagellar hook protein FlgE
MNFQQGLTGLNASSKNLDVIGNNIANANTFGAKTARAEFSHMYAAALGQSSENIGMGVSLDTVAQQFSQGNISSTGVNTDLAISGSGFFQLSDGEGQPVYTRNGQFKIDSTGSIVNNDGLHLLGYAADAQGVIQAGTPQPLKLPASGITPRTTAEIALEVNLDSRSAVTNPVQVATTNVATATAAKTTADAAKTAADTAKTAADTAKTNADTAKTNADNAKTAADAALAASPGNAALQAAATAAATTATNAAAAAAAAATAASNAAVTAAQAATAATDAAAKLTAANTALATAQNGAAIDFTDPKTFNNATSQTVYDAKGQSVELTYYFQKEGTDAAGKSTWNVFATANGTPVSTDATGKPTALAPQLVFSADGSTTTSVPAAFTIPSVTNAAGAQTLPITLTKLDFSTVTQFGSSFAVTKLTQDGYAPGNLTSMDIQADGTVMVQYSNGKSLAVGQVELANFRNPQGLQPLAGNVWGIAQAAGEPVRGAPGSGLMGKLQSKSLEESNVDLAGELVNMITAQRAYQANAQTIKTQDQLMQTLVNLR